MLDKLVFLALGLVAVVTTYIALHIFTAKLDKDSRQKAVGR